MMGKKTIIAVVIVLALGVGGFFLGTRLTGEKTGGVATTPMPLSPGQEKATTLEDLLASSTSRKCTFAGETESGIIYASEGRARLDFNPAPKTGDVVHMIIVDNIEKKTHLWKDGAQTGFFTVLGHKVTTKDVLSDTSYNFTCAAWTYDPSIFVPPQGVVFTETFSSQAPPPGATTSGEIPTLP